MGNLLESQETKAQKIWVWVIRFIGLVLFIAPYFLPIRAYFYESIANVTIKMNDVYLSIFGLFLSAGGKQIGIILNNVGIVIGNITNKLSK
jgi:hypothetical protein